MIKFKPLSKEKIIISIDRLTRFKHPETKYLRVFKEVILQSLISPSFSKADLEQMSYDYIRYYAQYILNASILAITKNESQNYTINHKLIDYENSVFNMNDETKMLLDNHIAYFDCLDLLKDCESKNLIWLSNLVNAEDIRELRKSKEFKYPIEKVILVEGATEETLLPVFGDLFGLNFDKNGVFLIPAGGKNPLVKLYYELKEQLKLPIFVLLDKDGVESSALIEKNIRGIDKIHVIKSGEFEDLLPQSLVDRTLSYELSMTSELTEEDLHKNMSRVELLEEIFKNRGFHEFKKSEFAHMVKNHINCESDLSAEMVEILEKIKSL